MEYISIGKIVNTHGIKGEVRILSNFKYKDKALKQGKTIYIGKEKNKETINSYRKHKIFDMITLHGITNINDVLKYKGKNIFTTRQDLNLSEDEYLEEDLIGMNILVNGKKVGILKDYIKDKYQDRIIIEKKGIQYQVPFVPDIIENINIKEKHIKIKEIKGLLE